MRASDIAYERLKDDILQWRLAPGTVLSEVEQSVRLGISRTPFREAVTRLASDGLVDVQRGRAGVVTGVDTESLTGLFELREALETHAVRLAARRRTPSVFEELSVEFRETAARSPREFENEATIDAYYALVGRLDAGIDDAMESPYLLASLRGLRTHLVRARRLSHDNPARLVESVAEHRLIVDAIVDGDETFAAQATAVHLRKSLINLLETIATAEPPAGSHHVSAGTERERP